MKTSHTPERNIPKTLYKKTLEQPSTGQSLERFVSVLQETELTSKDMGNLLKKNQNEVKEATKKLLSDPETNQDTASTKATCILTQEGNTMSKNSLDKTLKQHIPLLQSIARNISKDPDITNDLVQEGLIYIFNHPEKFSLKNITQYLVEKHTELTDPTPLSEADKKSLTKEIRLKKAFLKKPYQRKTRKEETLAELNELQTTAQGGQKKEDLNEDIQTKNSDPETLLIAEERKVFVKKLLRKISDFQKKVIELRFGFDETNPTKNTQDHGRYKNESFVTQTAQQQPEFTINEIAKKLDRTPFRILITGASAIRLMQVKTHKKLKIPRSQSLIGKLDHHI